MAKQNVCFLGNNFKCLGRQVCLFMLQKISPSNLMTSNIVPKRSFIITHLSLSILCNYSLAIISILPDVFLNPAQIYSKATVK